MKLFRPLLCCLICCALLSGGFFALAQSFPADGDMRTITETGALSTINDGCDPYDSYAFYNGSPVYFLLNSESLKVDNYAILNDSIARTYGNIFESTLKIPFVSSIQPKNGTSNTPTNKIMVTQATGAKIIIPSNYTTPRDTIAGQIVTLTNYRLLRSTAPMRDYFFTNTLGTKYTFSASSNFSTNNTQKRACVSYYIARCGDGITDTSIAGSSSKDGEGGIATKNDGFKTWHSASIKPNEVCDDGGKQGGTCNDTCTGPEGTTPTVTTLTVNKAIIGKTSGYAGGETIQYSIQITNAGSLATQNLKIRDVLPNAVEITSWSISGTTFTYSAATGSEAGSVVLTLSGFTLNAGQSATFLVNAKVKDAAGNTNSTTNTLLASADNASTVTTTATFTYAGTTTPVIFTKTTSSSTIYAGQVVPFTITLTNNLSSPMTNITITDVLPSCLTLARGSLTSSTLSLAPGASTMLYVDATVSSNPSCLVKITNTANVSYSLNGSPATASTDYSFTPLAADYKMSIKKEILKQSSKRGGAVKYKITYKNEGTLNIPSYTVTDYWPSTLTITKSTPQYTNSTSSGLVWSFTTPLAPQAEGTITLIGEIK